MPAWAFWQYSSTGGVPGIASTIPVDLNKFNGTQAQLLALATPSATGADGGAHDAGSDAGFDGGVIFTAPQSGCSCSGGGAGGGWAGMLLLLAGHHLSCQRRKR